ncbi:MAG: family 10 glycosylhydrolase [Chthonomonas sp.]|nr:family 10 glycosylhydrolase [Chthonomonas sp.]
MRLPLLLALTVLAGTASLAQPGPHQKPKESRFQRQAPFPSLPTVTLDAVGNGWGVAQTWARAKNLQGRILWVDGTANLERVSSEPKIVNLVNRIAEVGFNTIVFDVKPIVGYTLYPSKLTDKLTTWKGQNLPKDFDPLKFMARECKRRGVTLLVSLNAFSEGHRIAKEALAGNRQDFGPKAGPGYDLPDQQTVLYEPVLEARVPFSSETYPIDPSTDRMPTSDRAISVITRADRTKNPPARAVGVVIDDRGAVIMIRTTETWDITAVPENGSLLVGVGKAGEYLIRNARMGFGIGYASKPTFVKISDRPEQQMPLMMNPHHPRVRERGLDFIREILTNYKDVDGVMFDDRLRYGGLNADFSDITRAEFEKLVGEKLTWPDDVFQFTYTPGLGRGIKPGKWYDAWMAFRAETIRNWVAEARSTIRAIKPDGLFGVYAGSWFGEYNKYGAHYGSSEFNAGFSFMTDGYRKAGFASELDLMISGCYYPRATIAEAMEKMLPAGRTVEAAGQLTNRAIRDEAWSYAGIMLMDFYNNREGLKRALQAAAGSTQGVMVFDLSHKIDDVWDIFRSAFKERKKAPHAQRGLIAEVRKRRAELDKLGVKEPPVIIREGAPGAGH